MRSKNGFLVIIMISLFSLISCMNESEKYDSLTIAKVDTIKFFKDQMQVVFRYTHNQRVFLSEIDMDMRNIIPKNFPVYVKYSSKSPEEHIILLDSTVTLNDSLNVSYIHHSTGGWTYKIKKNER